MSEKESPKGDLKQEVLDALQSLTMRSSVPALTYDEVYALSARLRRATVTEPEPEPSNEELRERLQAALPEGWEVRDSGSTGGECAAFGPGWGTWLRYSSLLKPGGIEACARALKVLAGMEDK